MMYERTEFDKLSKEMKANTIARHIDATMPHALLGLDREVYAWTICRLRAQELVEIAERLGMLIG